MKSFYVFILFLIIIFCINCQKKGDSDTEKKENSWISLFNGKDINDWVVKISGTAVGKDDRQTFRVENGVLKVSYDNYDDFNDSFGHLFYKKPYSSYRLKLQYRFVGNQAKGGEPWAAKNSGIMIHSQSPESMGLNQGFPVSLEVQLLGGLEDGLERPTGNLCTPGTNVMMNNKIETTHCINSSSNTYYDDEWINVEVVVMKDSLISHRINGKEVIRYSRPTYGGEYTPDTEEWQAKNDKPLKEGYIVLQSESHPVEFRNILLLELNN
jgi:hypothetical protein